MNPAAATPAADDLAALREPSDHVDDGLDDRIRIPGRRRSALLARGSRPRRRPAPRRSSFRRCRSRWHARETTLLKRERSSDAERPTAGGAATNKIRVRPKQDPSGFEGDTVQQFDTPAVVEPSPDANVTDLLIERVDADAGRSPCSRRPSRTARWKDVTAAGVPRPGHRARPRASSPRASSPATRSA